MTPQEQKQPTLHTVNIRIDENGFVYTSPEHPNAYKIYVKRGDKVRWNCNLGNFSVLFKEKSPFDDIGAHGRKGFDTAVLTVIGPPGGYRYGVNVTLPHGLVVDDPEIIVGPDGG